MASSGLFLRDGDHLIALTEQAYEAENVLQGLLAKHPDLLPGEAMNPDEPRRFVLIRQEAPVGGMKLDHLFIDQDAVPTLVETKRGTNTQVQREVVAQVLDYAANAAGEWSADTLAHWLDEQSATAGKVTEDSLTELDHAFDNAAEFWAQVEQNLRDGKVRLVFVADEIPSSLQRIVEFLNERMKPTEVLAVEVRQYVSGDGKHLLQANLVGQTEKARDVKGQTRQPPALGVLVESGTLGDGQVLWLRREVLGKGISAGLDIDVPDCGLRSRSTAAHFGSATSRVPTQRRKKSWPVRHATASCRFSTQPSRASERAPLMTRSRPIRVASHWASSPRR